MTALRPGDPIVTAAHLTKVFHTTRRRPGRWGALTSLVAPHRVSKTAVNDVSFSVRNGELVALLGPNGAGKSTTIKMLTGILQPTSGSVTVAGIDPHRNRERNARNIGAIFGQRTQLWWDLPARESLAILRDIFEIDRSEYRRRLGELDELLDLSAFWDSRVRHLSLGQRVRCDLAASLLHDPDIVFLDEPTIGMDVVVKEQVREFLRHQVHERGRTVLLTTHDMTEVARLAERVVLVNHGQLVVDGTLDDIKRRFGGSWQVRVTLAEPGPDVDVGGLRVVRRDGPVVTFGPDPDGTPRLEEGLRRIVERHRITGVVIEEDDLEDVMRQAYLHRDAPDTVA
jgi:ABC-2 type transport system ATP-binding protein